MALSRKEDDVAKQLTQEELIAKAKKPGQDAMVLHPFYRGKLEMMSNANWSANASNICN